MGRIEGKVALVTGAASGIGRAIAERFAAEGAHVVVADVSGAEEALAAENPDHFTPYRCDVSSGEQVEGMFRFVAEKFPRLDILCNNAGIGRGQGRVHELEWDVWEEVLAVNVRGFFFVLKHGLKQMLAQGGGAVVNTASIGGLLATPGSSPYITSKGAQVMLSRTAALEYAKDNIRVNAVCPGIIASPMTQDMAPDLHEFLHSQIPQGRLGKPEEVASLALFLASDEASHITGACYVIDGGRSAG